MNDGPGDALHQALLQQQAEIERTRVLIEQMRREDEHYPSVPWGRLILSGLIGGAIGTGVAFAVWGLPSMAEALMIITEIPP